MTSISKKIFIILIICVSCSQNNNPMNFVRSFLFGCENVKSDKKVIPNEPLPISEQLPTQSLEDVKKILKETLEEVPIKDPHSNIHINLNLLNNQPSQNVNFKIDFFNPDYYKNFYKKSKDKINTSFSAIYKWAKNNKKKTFCYSLIFIHFTIQMRLIYLTYKLLNNVCWSQWQKHKQVEQLYQIPQSQFSQMLLNDIQTNYTAIKNPTDFVTPLVNFMYDSDKELKYLNQYILIIDWLKKCKISFIFWYKKELLDQAPERLKRLTFMKNNFLAWLVDFKLNQNQKTELFKKFPKLKLIKGKENEIQ